MSAELEPNAAAHELVERRGTDKLFGVAAIGEVDLGAQGCEQLSHGDAAAAGADNNHAGAVPALGRMSSFAGARTARWVGAACGGGRAHGARVGSTHRSFSVASDSNPNTIARIQKRTITLGSDHPPSSK